MRDLRDLNCFRLHRAELQHYGMSGDETCGMFQIPIRNAKTGITAKLRVVASSGGGWDHVSVSHPGRVPTWQEMSEVHRIFFPDEAAFQLHVPLADHINVHPNCLHLWRPQDVALPRPPGWMVG